MAAIASGGASLPPICLMGPTATGKTDLALALVERHPGLAIVSVDSAMVYRYMDIGTGKPDAATLARVPHWLVDIRDPRDPYSAGEFVRDAEAAIADIRARGQVPLLVGGTMLYFRSWLRGLSRLPAADPAVRAEIDAEAARRGWPALHAELAAVDPAAAARIGPNDRQRIQRALEVLRITGRPISAQQDRATAPARPALRIALLPSARAVLHERIARRLDGMLERGFVAEVARLQALPGMHRDQPALRAVGYRQIWAHLAGEVTLAEARERAIAATRQLARRQLTWLRAESVDATIYAEASHPVDDMTERLCAAGYADALCGGSR